MVAQAPLVKAKLLNGFSVDVEDWFQVGAFEKVIDPADWDGLACRVDVNTNRLWICAKIWGEGDLLHAGLGGQTPPGADAPHRRKRA
jgi:hypothetical protein